MKTLRDWVVSSLILVVAILALSVLAFGADATAPAAASTTPDILTSIMQIVALVLSGLVAWLVTILAAKFKLTISADQQALIRTGAKDAVFYAEEWAAAKYGADQLAGKGTEQLAAATSFLLAKIPGLDVAAAQQAITSALGGTPGVGASK